MSNELELDWTVQVGATHERYGHVYELVKKDPYIRMSDGSPSYVLTWRGTCADCGVAYDQQTGLQCRSMLRRCKDHRKAHTPTNGAAMAAKREGQLRSQETQRANRKDANRLQVLDSMTKARAAAKLKRKTDKAAERLALKGNRKLD